MSEEPVQPEQAPTADVPPVQAQDVSPEVAPIEPYLNLDEFAAVAHLRLAEVAAMRSWMTRQPQPEYRRRSYTLEEWRQLQTHMLAHR